MILGIGIDIVDIPKLTAEAFGNRLGDFKSFNFTEGEIRYAESNPSGDPLSHLSARWAAKEAFLKALDMTNIDNPPRQTNVDHREIEVVNDEQGRPLIRLHGKIKETSAGQGVKKISLSLSHHGPSAAAVVILE